MEFISATDRINAAFASLQTELREIRSQDISLMKQLMNINESIQNLSKKKTTKSRQRRMTRKVSRKPDLEAINDDDSQPRYTRRDEITLMTQVKLWKYSQSDESSSDSDFVSE